MSCMLRLLRRALTALTHTSDPSALTPLDGGPGPDHPICRWPTPHLARHACDHPEVVARVLSPLEGYGGWDLLVCRRHHAQARRSGWRTVELYANPADGQPLPEIDPTSYPPHATPLEQP